MRAPDAPGADSHSMHIGRIEEGSLGVQAPPRTPAVRRSVSERQSGSSERDAARMSSIVKLIESLTGRKVALVPPAAYLVSAPPAPEPTPVPARPAVELVVATDLMAEHRAGSGTLEVDITSILKAGTSDRMILAHTAAGALALFPAVDLAI